MNMIYEKNVNNNFSPILKCFLPSRLGYKSAMNIYLFESAWLSSKSLKLAKTILKNLEPRKPISLIEDI